MERAEEVALKLERVRHFMAQEGLQSIVLGGATNFAWITAGGDSVVALASERGVASVVITPKMQYVVTDNIEAGRLAEEELVGLPFAIIQDEWHKDNLNALIKSVASSPMGADGSWLPGARDCGTQLARLRWSLLPSEIERYRALGTDVSRCLTETAQEVEPGQTEHEIAALLTGKLKAQNIAPNVILIAADERIARYRHPLPTPKVLQRYVMLVASVRRHGLQASATRIVHFGAVPQELQHKHQAVTLVDACFNLETKPGVCVADIFAKAQQMYARTGYPDEWRRHHQGGATGYAGRDYKATPQLQEFVLENQAFAWNPSIAGTKSEDTIIVTQKGPEIITPAYEWPMLEVEYEGQILPRPDILVR